MKNLKIMLLDELAKIDGVENRPSAVSGGSALFYFGKEFAHFHSDHELDIRLTKRVIKSLGLSHPDRSAHHSDRSSNSPWIEVGFEHASDITRVVDLVRRAVAVL